MSPKLVKALLKRAKKYEDRRDKAHKVIGKLGKKHESQEHVKDVMTKAERYGADPLPMRVKGTNIIRITSPEKEYDRAVGVQQTLRKRAAKVDDYAKRKQKKRNIIYRGLKRRGGIKRARPGMYSDKLRDILYK